MATGQVSFRDQKLTKKVHIPARLNPTVNRLNKTKVEKYPDLHAEREENLREKRQAERRLREDRKVEERREKQERDQLRYQKEHAYDDLMDEGEVAKSSNQDRDADFLDDFM